MSDLAELIDSLERTFPHAVTRTANLGELTTYRVGGSAAALIRVVDNETLDRMLAIVGGSEIPMLMVGRGSNLLVSDNGVALLAVQLGEFFTTVTVEGSSVVAGGAAKLPVVARTTVQHGLTGFEWAVGVPGSVGGAVRMNAGGHGAEMVDSVVAVDVVDFRTGHRTIRSAAELDFGYRRSNLASHELVVGCQLGLAADSDGQGRERIADIVRWRREHQPGGQNAGSVFANPDGDSAGRLIDQAGGRGMRIGSAEVSTKHANFIQVDDGGSADDVVELMIRIWELVRDVHQVDLRPETRLVGFDPSRFPWVS